MMRGSLQEHAEHAVLCLTQLLELEGGQRGGGLGKLALLLGGYLQAAGVQARDEAALGPSLTH